MAFFVEDPRRKPEKWGPVTPGFVAPEWVWAWQGLRAVIPFWEGQGPPFDANIRKPYVVSGAPSWGVVGVGHRLALTVDENISLVNANVDLSGGTGISLLIKADWTINPTATRRALTLDNNANTSWEHGVQNIAAGNQLQWGVNVAGGSLDNVTASKPTASEVVVCTWDLATLRIYFDGIEQANGAKSAASINATSRLQVGRLSQFGPSDISPSVVAVWARGLSPAEVSLISRDPFGPFRMAVPMVWKAPAAVAGQPYIKRLGGVPHMALNPRVW